jgi:hypothetical protein
MPIYTVHEPPRRDDELLAHTARFRFVRDGFHFWAFLLAPFWMLRHRLWLELIAYLLLVGGVTFALAASDSRKAHGAGLVCDRSLVGSKPRAVALEACARGFENLGVVVGEIRRMPSGVLRRLGARQRAPRLPLRGPAFAAAPDRHRRLFRSRGAAMTVAIVDYGSGNLHSAAKAFERAARESERSADSGDRRSRRCAAAERIVLPASARSRIAAAGSMRSPAWSRR